MSIDEHSFRIVAAIVAVVALNVPIGIAALQLLWLDNFSQSLHEKTPDDDAMGPVSYSRVTGMVGSVIVGSLFWIVSNIVVATAILDPRQLATILGNVGTIFLIGAALFLPYAFNQLKTLIQ